MRNEAQVLADMFALTRASSMAAIEQLRESDCDLHQVFEVAGKPMNSAFWILAHLAVSENFLMLHATGGERVRIPWARNFGLGSTPLLPDACPPLEEVLEIMQTVHERSQAHVRQLTAEQLGAPTVTGTDFGGKDEIRSVIMHAIRHEGMHAGHLGWICKWQGLKTI